MSVYSTVNLLSKLGDRYYHMRKIMIAGAVRTIVVGDGDSADEARESCDEREARLPALRALRASAEFDHQHGLEQCRKGTP